MPRVFISYKRADKDKVFPLKEKIETAIGEPCWIDLDGIESDAQFVNVIMQAIDDSEIFLFMYSKEHSCITDYEKDWTVREINYAQDQGKRIVFVKIDKAPLTKWFKFIFGLKQQVDATSLESFNRLINDLCSWLEINNIQAMSELKSSENLDLDSLRIKKKYTKYMIFTIVSVLVLSLSGIMIYYNEDAYFVKWIKSTHASKKYQRIDYADLSHGRLYGIYEAIDLGLSIKWSTHNVGTTLPHLTGDFFAWGEVYPKDDYSWGSYIYSSANGITKYCSNDLYGNVDNINILCKEDDAAQFLWGEGWRMPTLEETEELRSKCTFLIKELYGALGFHITGPNGNSIFIPLSGDINGREYGGKNVYAIFWTSNLHSNNKKAYEFAMSHLNNYWYCADRYIGHNIRPVHE